MFTPRTTRFLTFLLSPILIANLLGGVVSGVWLTVLGQFEVIGYGLLLLIFGHWILAGLLIPGFILFQVPAMALGDGGGNKLLSRCLFLLSLAYTYLIFSSWCLVILFIAIIYFANDLDASIPILLWSYGVATTSISFMAQKEQNEFGMASALAIQFAYLLSIFVGFFHGFFYAVPIFVLVMLATLLIQFFVSLRLEKEIENEN